MIKWILLILFFFLFSQNANAIDYSQYDVSIQRAIKEMQLRYAKNSGKYIKAIDIVIPSELATPEELKNQTNTTNKKPGVFNGFKDDLFAYKAIVSEEAEWKYKLISYSQKRDLEERDEVPEKKVSAEYRSIEKFDIYKKDKTFSYNNKKISYVENTKAWVDIKKEDVKYLTIYIHGLNGNRWQWVNDYTFGWNFNRIQNLMLENNGSYIATEFSDFWVLWMSQVRELIKQKKKEYPNVKVYVACWSSGWAICWWLANNNEGNKLLNGLLILGSSSGNNWLNNKLLSTNRSKLLPIFIAHGEKDRVIGLQGQKNFFYSVLSKNKNYPIRMHTFTNWTHWTPIRMLDWKVVMEWMIKNS